MDDISPNNITLIPIKDKILVFDMESDPSLGLGAQVGGLGGTPARAVSKAINNEGNLVTDIINARLDSSAKTILADFTFGASGALQIGAYEAGVSGDIKISPAGIVGRNSADANTFTLDGTTGEITAIKLVGASGSIGGWNISATALYYDGETDDVSAGMASADYPFYAGKQYASRATAPFRVTPAGAIYASAGVIEGTLTVGGRLATTIGGSINIDGNFVNNIINTNLDTSAKEILGDFTFGESGAIKMITDENNGLWISPTGILAKKAGENTFTIGIDGTATFAGTLSAAAGTFGLVSATAKIALLSEGIEIGSINNPGASSGIFTVNIPDDTDSRSFYSISNKTDGEVVNSFIDVKGYQIGLRIQNDNTNAYRTTNNVPLLDIFNLGTGTGIRIIDSGTDSTGIPLDIQAPNNPANTNPAIKITNSGSAGDIQLTNLASDPTSGVVGQICVVSGILKYCSSVDPLTWTTIGGGVTDHGELDGLADDDHTQYVETTGNETIDGIKTFSLFPVTPSSAPAANYDVANKKYVDDSTGGSKVAVVYTDVTVTDTTTETNLIQVPIPAGILGTNNAIRVRIFIDYLKCVTTGTDSTLRFYYGNTTIATIAREIGGDDQSGYIECWLLAAGATDDQEGSMTVDISTQGYSVDLIRWYGQNYSAGASEDSTGALNLTVTWQWGTANAGNIIRMRHAIVEKID